MDHLRKWGFLSLVALLGAGSVWAQVFTTGDAPVVIPDNTGTATTCQSINIASSITITDLNVEIAIGHSWVGDLTYVLTGPGANALTLMNRPGRNGTGAGNSDDLVATTPVFFNDEAPSGASAETMGNPPCDGIIGVSPNCPDNYIPAPDATDTPIPGVGTNLAQYIATDAQGTWTLCIGDSAAGDTGTLATWSLGVNGFLPVELQRLDVE